MVGHTRSRRWLAPTARRLSALTGRPPQPRQRARSEQLNIAECAVTPAARTMYYRHNGGAGRTARANGYKCAHEWASVVSPGRWGALGGQYECPITK